VRALGGSRTETLWSETKALWELEEELRRTEFMRVDLQTHIDPFDSHFEDMCTGKYLNGEVPPRR
jgi:hypothetical protein